MYSFELINQYHLSVDFERLAAFAAGFEVESFLHGAGGIQSFRFKSVLFARRQGFPEGRKRSLTRILFSQCQTFSFGTNVGLCLFLGFFGLLALLSLEGTFESGWQRDRCRILDRLDQKSGAA